MATKNPQDTLARHVLEKDLSIIAKSIGSNWELLAPYLLETNGMTTVEHIKADHAKTEMRIFYLLLTWSKEAGPDATLGLLFHKMLQPGTSVMIEWRTIAKKLDIDEREIRACKTDFKNPVHETGVFYRGMRMVIDMEMDEGRATEPNKTEGMVIDKEVVDEGHATGPNQTEPMETDIRGPVFGKGIMEVDGRHVRKVVGAVDGPCLSDKRNEKAVRPPKQSCIFDGRLLKLEEKDIKTLEKSCTQMIGKGSFGEVYRSEDDVDGFGMKIALKKIKPGANDSHPNSAIRREMSASRILHPFILPLLAVVDHPLDYSEEVWIVSPFFEKGDLYQAIRDKKIDKKDMRIKILLQLATAIQYIHTKVPNVRDAILHKDISSKNVVLDQANNARLIDFGLAREKDDQTTHGGGRKYYDHPDCGTGEPATECWDYYSFGVIVREMLTGLGPEGHKNLYLMKMKSKVVLNNLENKVWLNERNAEFLNRIADQCLLPCKEWTVDTFKEEVVKKIKSEYKGKIFDVPDENSRCHICMINPKQRPRNTKETSETEQHAANCQQKIEVCIACEKNSFMNPIACYCGTKLSPLGSRRGALLIAGNDKNKKMAKALTKDVTELKQLLTSKAPCIVGISEDNVRMVTPNIDDDPDSKAQKLLPNVEEHVKYFGEQTDLDTLLIYFSGHCAWDNESNDVESSSFMLGSVSEIVTLTYFQDMLDKLDKIDNLIIILDRCYPPKIDFRKKNRKMIQLNACGDAEQAQMTNDGSRFTQTLIQGLKGKAAESPECPKECELCKDYFGKSSDFIRVHDLHEYLKNHIKGQVPRLIQNSDSSNIAYFTDEQVQIQFDDLKNNEQQTVKLDYLQKMEQLQRKLYEEFIKDESKYRVKVQRDTYRKDERFEDCDTIEKVMQAWVQRQPLIVQFELI